MKTEPSETSAVSKAGENQFVSGYDGETRQRNGQGVPMKQRDAEQSQRKQDKIDWNSEKQDWFCQRTLDTLFLRQGHFCYY
jgi:hypothetical protein